jgi:hypothetical protein
VAIRGSLAPLVGCGAANVDGLMLRRRSGAALRAISQLSTLLARS